MRWYLAALRKYAVLRGRTKRREYWMFAAVHVLLSLLMILVDSAAFGFDAAGPQLFSAVYGLALLVPSFTAAVRRLHDTNKSGWWCLIALVPIIGGIGLVVLLAIDGTHGTNHFGPDPAVLV